MAAHPLSTETLKQTISLVEDALRDGFGPPWAGGGAIEEAGKRALAAGMIRSIGTFNSRYSLAKRTIGEPDWALWRATNYQRPMGATTQIGAYEPQETVRPTGKKVKVCVIGDAHDDPRLEDKDRFKWMGRWCAHEAPDYVIQLGDWGTFDSMSKHAQPGSLSKQLQPSWMQDLESLHLSIGAFEKGLKGKVKKIMTAGNHKDRVARYEDSNPDIAGALVPQWKQLFQSEGWRIHEFGEYAFIEGVGFIHYIVNGMGRAYGGKTGNQRAGNDSVFSIVHGHDHRLERTSAPKVGPFKPVEVISAGCSLPWGWVEPYAKLSPAGWWWGVSTLTIQEGMILDMQATSMLTLEEKFGDKGWRRTQRDSRPKEVVLDSRQ